MIVLSICIGEQPWPLAGPHVTSAALPENQEVVLQTPWELRIEGGMVTAALDEEHAKALYE